MTAFYEPGGTGEIYGLVELEVPDSYRAWFGNLFHAFPDFQLEIIEVVPRGEKGSGALARHRHLQWLGKFRRARPQRRPRRSPGL